MRHAFRFLALVLAFLVVVPAAQAAGAKKYRVVLQWTEADSLGQWVMTKHVGNLLDDLGENNVQLEVLAYGMATFAVTTTRPQTKFAADIEALTKRGVTFHVCHHAMDLLGVKDAELLPTVTPVKGAMWYLTTKHDEGWYTLRP
ncbi:MAG: DsrE family protein [Candidatus Eiseniibacteriota bacterium]